MLPSVDSLFTLVRHLADRSSVTEISTPKWLVRQHGLAPMTARAGVSRFRDDLVRSAVEWSRIESELPIIVTGMVNAGIRVAPIKGVAFAKTLYATPSERPMSDIDLLIAPGQEQEARVVLKELGLIAVPGPLIHHAEAWIRKDLVIDLHWNIISPGRSRIDLAEVWSRTAPGWPPGAEQLEPGDALVFHLIHMIRNRLRVPLMHVIDTARLLELVQPDVAFARSKAWQVGTAVELALRFCLSILRGPKRRPVGWIGPSCDEIARLAEPSLPRKILFDAAVAGSPAQLAARALAYATNRLARR